MDAAVLVVLGVLFALQTFNLIRQEILMGDMSQELDGLIERVAAIETGVDSLIAFNHGLADMLHVNAEAPAKIHELADRLKAKSDAIAEALQDNPGGG